jgi:hypothetical protein
VEAGGLADDDSDWPMESIIEKEGERGQVKSISR